MLINMLTGGSSIGENVISALSSMALWTAVAKSVIIILLGFLFTKIKLLPDATNKILTKIVMNIALPCLAFTSFMTSITLASFKSALFSFVYGFVIYLVMIGLSKVMFLWVKNPTKRKVFEILFAFGSTTFFGQPLISAVFPLAYNDSSVFNIAYRVFLYSYAYYVICLDNKDNNLDTSNNKMSFIDVVKKIFLNPIIIATFLGFGLWALQLIGNSDPTSEGYLAQWWIVEVNSKSGPFWNISISLPWLNETLKTLGNLASPLVWISIGCTLGKVSFKTAATDPNVWIYSLIKVIIGPIINLALLFLIHFVLKLEVSFNVVASTTLMWAVPAATVAVSYCLSANKEPEFASSCSLISTFVAIVFIPIYMVLLTIIQSAGIFA